MITSSILNLRSRKLNYHAAMNSLILWDNRVPKRLIQAFNHLGISTSYGFQIQAIAALSKNSLLQAQKAANDPAKIKMLPYDNFNWTAYAVEATALNKSATHDEVSALLVILPTPIGESAEHITSIPRFEATARTRHELPPRKSLADIMPTSHDQQSFRENSIIHLQNILVTQVEGLAKFSPAVPSFRDSAAIFPAKTEQYYLPTFDQEQGSTRGNMVVLEHYFGKVLNIPVETFERTMFTVLGDRLTTVRDRAAQDQRAVDRSAHRFDHLSSFSMTSGLMHFGLNFIHAAGGNFWGSEGRSDAVSLITLRNVLPNRTEINLQKVDYYGWLRFLDVILNGLAVTATMTILGVERAEALSTTLLTAEDLQSVATKIVDQFLLLSVDRLEASGAKSLQGSTQSGHAVLLMHDLMTLREMQHAIKHGHPQRIARMIKYWLPMFYVGGSYNYANECMEVLHNIVHDWPKDYASVAFNGMLVNPRGKPDGFKPTDINVEHLNDHIKERAHGPNITPDVLEKITPAIGHVSLLSDQLFEDIGVEGTNQKHAHVSQHKDIQLITNHLYKSAVFDFTRDKSSEHAVVDLYLTGITRLAGKNGGHVKHLSRHILRLQTRHGDHLAVDTELSTAHDAELRSHTLNSREEDTMII